MISSPYNDITVSGRLTLVVIGVILGLGHCVGRLLPVETKENKTSRKVSRSRFQTFEFLVGNVTRFGLIPPLSRTATKYSTCLI